MNADPIRYSQSPQKAQNPEAPHIIAGRLNTGWLMIDRETDPARKERLEEHWLCLLHAYESACEPSPTITDAGDSP